jgi:hypothetical protein
LNPARKGATQKRSSNKSFTTIKAPFSLGMIQLRKILNLAVTWGIISVSPVMKVKPYTLPVDNQRDWISTDEEETRLLKAREPSLPGQAEYLGSVALVALHTRN